MRPLDSASFVPLRASFTLPRLGVGDCVTFGSGGARRCLFHDWAPAFLGRARFRLSSCPWLPHRVPRGPWLDFAIPDSASFSFPWGVPCLCDSTLPLGLPVASLLRVLARPPMGHASVFLHRLLLAAALCLSTRSRMDHLPLRSLRHWGSSTLRDLRSCSRGFGRSA